MNCYFSYEREIPGFSNKKFLAPLAIGVAFIGMGAYIRNYDSNENGNLSGFGLVCLIMGCCWALISICWVVFERKDRQDIRIRNRARQNYANRAFFLDLSNNGIYSNYLHPRNRRNSRWIECELSAASLQPPPTYQEAVSSVNQPSFIRLQHDYSNRQSIGLANRPQQHDSSLVKYLNQNSELTKKTDKLDQAARQSSEPIELCVINLQNLCLPSYDEALASIMRQSDSSESTKM